MQLERTDAGYHLTLPAWRWVTALTQALAWRSNPMPDGSESVDNHIHHHWSIYPTKGVALKLSDGSLFTPDNLDAVTIHFIRPEVAHPWKSVRHDAVVMDGHPHQEHHFAAV